MKFKVTKFRVISIHIIIMAFELFSFLFFCSQESYGFSAPKLHLSTSAAPVAPQPAFSASLPAPTLTLSQQPPPKTLPAQPSLKNTSVVDALRKPEYGQFLKGTKSPGKSQDIVDLTNSDDENVPAPKMSSSLKPLPQFAPSAGSWSCEECFVSNKASDVKCVACGASKPGDKKSTLKTGGLTGGLCGPSLSLSAQVPKSKSSVFPALTTPASDSWTCDTCLVPNKAQDVKCVACSTAKPGVEPSNSAAGLSTGLSLSSTGGLKLSGGITLGGGDMSNTGGTEVSSSGGFKLGRAGLSSSGGGLKLGGTGVSSSGGGLKLGGAGVSSSGGGLKLGGAGVSLGGVTGSGEGFKLEAGISLGGNQLKPLSSSLSSKDSWSCGTCMVVNKGDASTCVACSASKSDQSSTNPPSMTSGAFRLGGASLSAPKTSTSSTSSPSTDKSDSTAAQWTCNTCWVSNKADASVCVACSASKPDAEKKDGSETGLQFGSTGGLKLGAVVTLGSLPGASSSLTPSLTTASTGGASGKDTLLSQSTSKPTFQFGTSSTAPMSVPKLTGPLFPDNKQLVASPLTGIKLGGDGGPQTVSNPLAGIKLGTVAFGRL